MADVSVACGCGRTMTVDSLRGKGAYRCGCGNRIKVDIAPPKYPVEQCVAILANGSRCTGGAVTPAPLRVCTSHEQYRRPEAERFARGRDDVRPASVERQREQRHLDHYAAVMARDYPPVVYFIRRSGLVKIGYTTNFAQRMATLMPDDVLAVEPGTPELERQRHRQFHKSCVSGEWFRPTDEMNTLIVELQEQHNPLLTRLTQGGWRGEIFAAGE